MKIISFLLILTAITFAPPLAFADDSAKSDGRETIKAPVAGEDLVKNLQLTIRVIECAGYWGSFSTSQTGGSTTLNLGDLPKGLKFTPTEGARSGPRSLTKAPPDSDSGPFYITFGNPLTISGVKAQDSGRYLISLVSAENSNGKVIIQIWVEKLEKGGSVTVLIENENAKGRVVGIAKAIGNVE